MLARMFSSAEATALWMQIVESRLTELERTADPNQVEGMAAVFARAQGLQIRREDLATWDASARAWLESADQVKRLQYTQLKLIVKNIPSITGFGTTYADVMKNWRTAMLAAQKSISGAPQDVSNGCVLLGLLAWHIYPDIQVYNPDRFVVFDDELVKRGGDITLGLETTETCDDGVRWSLSLSHLRYYGDPVIIERSINDSDRLTSQELRLVAFGAFIHSWAKPELVSITEAAECFAALGDLLQLDLTRSIERRERGPLDWLLPLIQAARDFLSFGEKEKENALYRIEYGRRRGRNFLDPRFLNTPPMFGLANPYLRFNLSHTPHHGEDDLEPVIASFRSLSEECAFHESDAIIISQPMAKPRVNTLEDTRVLQGNIEIASALKQQLQSNKRSTDGQPILTKGHRRWIHVDRTTNASEQKYLDRIEDQPENPPFLDPEFNPESNYSDGCFCHGQAQSHCGQSCPCRNDGKKCTTLCLCLSTSNGSERHLHCSNVRQCRAEAEDVDEPCDWLSVPDIKSIKDKNFSSIVMGFQWLHPPASFVERYSCLKPSVFAPAPSLPEPTLFAFEGYSEQELSPNSLIEPHFLSFAASMNHRSSKYASSHHGTSTINVIRKIQFRQVATKSHVALLLSDRAPIDMPSCSLAQLIQVFKSTRIDRGLLEDYLRRLVYPEYGIVDHSRLLTGQYHHSEVLFSSLEAVWRVSQLYHDWPEATISTGVAKRPLGLSHWARLKSYAIRDGASQHLHRSAKFSCLALMESGEHDIHLDQVQHVMAMATGNSIYAAEYLLQDPCKLDRSGTAEMHGIRRILGNLGYPGIVMLVPPPKPLSLKLGINGSRITADEFGGEFADSFGTTSLHLRCTDFTVRLAGAQGAVDGDVIIREALVQAYDGPRWVTDLDLLTSLMQENLTRLDGCKCVGTNQSHNGVALHKVAGLSLRSITKWDELLLCQENLIGNEIGVVWTAGNWYGRLAVAGLAALKGWPTLIWPEDPVCDNCASPLIERAEWGKDIRDRRRVYIM